MTPVSPGPRLPREPSHPRWARRQGPSGAPTPRNHPAGQDPIGQDPTGQSSAGEGSADEESSGAESSGAKREPSAYNAALNLLAIRGHSRAELAGRLARRGFDPEKIEAALVRLEQARLLDEEAYAASFAASRAARGVAATVIRRDLAARGVDGDLAARAAAAASPAEAEADRCRELAMTWLARRPGLPGPVAARRLAGYLARRGYQAEAVAGVVLALTGGDLAGEADRDSDPDSEQDAGRNAGQDAGWDPEPEGHRETDPDTARETEPDDRLG